MFNYDSVMVFREHINLELTDLIKRHSTPVSFAQGEHVVQPGDSLERIFYIAKGKTCHYSVNDDGSERIIYYLNPGFFIGEGAFVRATNKQATRYVRAETDCLILRMVRADYEQLKQHDVFMTALLRSSAQKNSFLRNEVENMSFYPLTHRLLNLVAACTDGTHQDGEYMPMRVRLTQQQMGAILGATRVSISKTIKKLCDYGVLRMVNKNLQVKKSCVQSSRYAEWKETGGEIQG